MQLSKRIIVRTLIGLIGLVGSGVILTERVVAYKMHQIMHPVRADNYAMTDGDQLALQPVTFKTVDGLTLTGWYLPPRNQAVIILQHGYRANSAQMLPAGLMLARHGYGVFWFDFRGHGKSEGNVVSLGLHEVKDTHAAVAFLQQQVEGDALKIGLLGNSMGGATGVLATADNPAIQALAIEGTFAELKDEVGIGIQLQTALPSEPFASAFIFFAEWQTGYKLGDIAPVKRIQDISPRPILIMQGGNDSRILKDSGERLWATAKNPKHYWYEPSATHVALYATVPDEYEQQVVTFFDTYLLNSVSQ